MLQKIEIINYKGLKHDVFEVGKLTTIAGKNGLYKSTRLDASYWAVTGKHLSDNYGVNESDDTQITPSNFQKGDDDSTVIFYFDNGKKLAKVYQTKFSKNDDSIKHTIQHYRNDTPCTSKEYQESLYAEFSYIPTFNVKGFDEVQFLSDPTYLQTIDYKVLREFLVRIGCSVDEDEILEENPGFNILTKMVSAYDNKYEDLRKDYGKKKKAASKAVEDAEAVFKKYASVDEYDNSHLLDLQQQVGKLYVEKEKVHKSSDLVAQTEQEIKEAKFELDKYKLSRSNEVDREINQLKELRNANQSEILTLEGKLSKAELEARSKVEVNTREAKTNLDLALKRKQEIIDTIKAYDKAFADNEKRMSAIKAEAISNSNEYNNMSRDIEAIKLEEFPGYVTCPCCGKQFVTDEAKLIEFSSNKEARIERLVEYKHKLSAKNTGLGNEDKALRLANKDITTEKASLNSEQEELINRIEALQKEVLDKSTLDISVMQSITKEIEKLEAKDVEYFNKIMELSKSLNIVSNEENELIIHLNALQEKKAKYEADSQEAIKLELQAYQDKIDEINEEIAVENGKAQLWQEKLKTREEVDTKSHELAQVEGIYELVDMFIKEKIKRINDKAKDITGFEIKMLEQNLSNDGVTECCKIVIDGVDYENVNTGRKLEVAINFIENVKKIAGGSLGNLPIFIDRVESITSDYNSLTDSQIIATKVVADLDINISC